MPSRTVDPLYIPFTVTTPAGTAIATPLTTLLPVDKGTLVGIDLVIPPGHRGQTGIRFTLSGQQIVPWSNVAAWIVGDDFTERFAIDVQADSKLAAVTYNVGNFAHSHFVRAIVKQQQVSHGVPNLTLIDTSTLGGL